MNPHSYRLKGRDFVHQGKIEIDVNERAVFIRTQGCFFVYTNSDCFLNSLMNPEETIPQVLEELEQAGMNKILESQEEQLKEFMKSK